MQYWFLMMVIENSWASKCLELNKRLQGSLLNTCARPGNTLSSTAHSCEELSTHQVPWPPSGNKAPQKGDCAAGRSSHGLSIWAKAFGIWQLPARHPVPSEDGRIHQLQQEENQALCLPFSAQIHSAFRQKRIWTSSEHRLSTHIQLSAPRSS